MKLCRGGGLLISTMTQPTRYMGIETLQRCEIGDTGMTQPTRYMGIETKSQKLFCT